MSANNEPAQTTYLIQVQLTLQDEGESIVVWRDIGEVKAGGAAKAKRTWAESMPADFIAAHVRCIPLVNLNEGDVAAGRKFDVT